MNKIVKTSSATGSISRVAYFFLVVLIFVLHGPLPASAELINLQFQDSSVPSYSGAAVIGSSGDTWNQLTSSTGSAGSLKNSTGNISNVSVSWTGNGFWNGYSKSNANGFKGTAFDALMNSYLYTTPGSGLQTISFSNLQASTKYTLYMYTQADTDALGRALTVTVNGLTQTTTPTDYTASTFIKGQNYLEFNATTDNSGALLISYMSAPGTAHKEEADINGIQLASAPTPEPSTLVLMGIGGLLVAFRFRKSGAGAGSILSA